MYATTKRAAYQIKTWSLVYKIIVLFQMEIEDMWPVSLSLCHHQMRKWEQSFSSLGNLQLQQCNV